MQNDVKESVERERMAEVGRPRPARERRLVTVALVLGMFLAALEATAVATAMPTAIAELGGVSRYSWVFSAYLLTSTTTVPLYGKLADLHGRRRIYLIAVALFLLGSALSGAAASLEQLIVFRAIQGLGAGGVMPVSITLIGDIYPLEQRGRVQGLFSSVWGVSSLIGPALGGIITDLFSWRWVFYFNLPFGLPSAVILALFFHERPTRRENRLDLPGTLGLTTAVTLLLVALLEGSEVWGWTSPATLGLLGAAMAGLALFLWHETRAVEPMLPLDLFRSRVISVSSAGTLVVGTLLFSASAFVPMYVQGVLAGTAADAGATLAPMSIGWPIASTLAGRLLLRVGYRRLVILGGFLTLAGAALLAGASHDATRADLMISMLIMGLGMGFTSTPYIVAVQNAVPWARRGVATSSVQFFRTIGGAVAVASLGAILNTRLARVLGSSIDSNAVLDPELRAGLPPHTLRILASALGDGLSTVFLAFVAVAAGGLVIAFLFPPGPAAAHAYREAEPPSPES